MAEDFVSLEDGNIVPSKKAPDAHFAPPLAGASAADFAEATVGKHAPVSAKPSGGQGLRLDANGKMPRRLCMLDVYNNGVRVNAAPRSILTFVGANSIHDFPHEDSVEVDVTPPTAQVFGSSTLTQSLQTPTNISTGVLTAIPFDLFTSVPGNRPAAAFGPASSMPSGTVAWVANNTSMVCTLVVTWPAGTYDRYIELTISNPFFAEEFLNPRYRTGVTPQGDVMTLTAEIPGSAAGAMSVTANVFQASGSNKAITAMWLIREVGGILVTP